MFHVAQTPSGGWDTAAHRPADSNTLSEDHREVKSLSGFPSLSGSIKLLA